MAEYFPPPPPPGTHYTYYPPPPPGAIQVAAAPPPQLPQPYIPQAEASYVTPFATYSSYGDVRTLFVAGLPEDVKPREIYNLFREFPGYESSHLRSPTQSSQPFAFAVFSDQQSAIVAMQALNGFVFDLDKGSTLYIDLAKSNSRSKRSRTDDEWTGSDKKARGSFSSGTLDSGKWIAWTVRLYGELLMLCAACLIHHLDYKLSTESQGRHYLIEAHIAHVLHAWALAGFGSVHMPGMVNSAYNMIAYPPTQSQGNFDARGANEMTAGKLNNSSAPCAQKSGTPCPTLFVANLGATCTEQELIQVFSRCPGFLKLKMQSTYGPPVAFVDFQDTASSTASLNSLQGTILYSSPAGDGMRLEFAKSRMGKPRKPK
ncbi:hypothetical protein EZV62_013961 [Acer yangbiense]|uniref:RRM domain-containing protein n=1 Tax=Acer yangbiense TaxID=1000413 RepID=A0A5C7HRF7_9ROSI|nr:hypothetical protein EZV62_013961 [Acer yangbiense]